MLAREHRLVRPDDFRRAVRAGSRGSSRTVVAHLAQPAGATEVGDGPASAARIGFVVSRSVGGAVVRNAVTRRLRHLARELVDEFPGSAVLVVRALPASAEASYADLRADLRRAVERARRTAETRAERSGLPAVAAS